MVCLKILKGLISVGKLKKCELPSIQILDIYFNIMEFKWLNLRDINISEYEIKAITTSNNNFNWYK
ncbi:hypothetical protein SAMN03097699_0063 [Flavobacteriaceae bacterium MAR_2010_188]|nr:hypothetical protein SAMN03097699_0063 [Flavobacteriaceae bacterium MAR_2010_188]